MFDSLSEKLQGTLSGVRQRGALTEDDINAAMREIRLALLEADVNFKVVKDFVARVKERAMGSDVLDSLTPGQQVVKMVHGELNELMGQAGTKLSMSNRPPTVILMAGLQGSGKTTAAGKLARLLAKQKRKPAMVAAATITSATIMPTVRNTSPPSRNRRCARSVYTGSVLVIESVLITYASPRARNIPASVTMNGLRSK